MGFYSADTFNEMTPPSADPAYLTAVTSAIYNVRDQFEECMISGCHPAAYCSLCLQAMAAADPGAKWLMQAWLFYDNQEFWQPLQIEAGTPLGILHSAAMDCNAPYSLSLL